MIAPNKLNEIRAIAAAHPEIHGTVDGPFAPNRGGITQLAALQFGWPFGRKSKDKSATNLSDDALCYDVGGGRFEIYDILRGVEVKPGETPPPNESLVVYSYAGTFANGENGYFILPSGEAPPQPEPGPTPPQPQPPSGLTEADVRRIAQEELAKPRTVALRTWDGVHFVCAEGAGGGEVNATRTGNGPWETFTLLESKP